VMRGVAGLSRGENLLAKFERSHRELIDIFHVIAF
jgi:hypothetical protein